MHHPGIEPGSPRWQRGILPLDQWCQLAWHYPALYYRIRPSVEGSPFFRPNYLRFLVFIAFTIWNLRRSVWWERPERQLRGYHTWKLERGFRKAIYVPPISALLIFHPRPPLQLPLQARTHLWMKELLSKEKDWGWKVLNRQASDFEMQLIEFFVKFLQNLPAYFYTQIQTRRHPNSPPFRVQLWRVRKAGQKCSPHSQHEVIFTLFGKEAIVEPKRLLYSSARHLRRKYDWFCCPLKRKKHSSECRERRNKKAEGYLIKK